MSISLEGSIQEEEISLAFKASRVISFIQYNIGKI